MSASDKSFVQKLLRLLPTVVSIAVFGLVVWGTVSTVRTLCLSCIVDALQNLSATSVALAGLATVGAYITLALYDVVTFKYFGYKMPLRTILVSAIASNGISNSTGFSVVVATGVRYRYYTHHGINAVQLAKITGFGFSTFVASLFLMAGLAMVIVPQDFAILKIGSLWLQSIGTFFLISVAIYLLVSYTHGGKPFRLGKHTVQLPGLGITLLQTFMTSLELSLTALSLYLLLPASALGFLTLLGFYIFSQIGTHISQIPGGLGVLDGIIFILLRPFLPAESIVASLLAFRTVFYLAPLAVSLGLYGFHEARTAHKKIRRHRANN